MSANGRLNSNLSQWINQKYANLVYDVEYNVLSVKVLCCLQSLVAHRDHFVWHLPVHLSVCVEVICLVITLSHDLQAKHAFLGMLPAFSGIEIHAFVA